MDNEYLRNFLLKAQKDLKEKFNLDLTEPSVQDRIRTEVFPVIEQLKDLLSIAAGIAAETDVIKQSQDYSLFLLKIKTVFFANYCAIAPDSEGRFTSVENAASIQWNESRNELQLLVSPQMTKNPASPEEISQTVREYMHELSALLLMTQNAKKSAITFDGKTLLSLKKKLSVVPTEFTYSYADIIDATLLAMIESRKTK